MRKSLYDELYFKWPLISPETQQNVLELLKTGNISFDENIYNQLEQSIKSYFNIDYALLTCNGTSAAFSAFHAINLTQGDEILMPAYTHWATVVPAKQFTNNIKFYDSEPDSFSPNPEHLEELLSPSTKAVVVCHLYGNPVNMPLIKKFCDKNNLLLIEDVSHAVGATIEDKKVGTYSDIAFFSMQASKIVFAGEGGALITSNFEYYARALELGHPKRIKNLLKEWHKHINIGLGFKFRLSTIHAVIALESFKNLEKQIENRNKACNSLMEELKKVDGIRIPALPKNSTRVYWQQEFFIDGIPTKTEEIAKLLQEMEINAFTKNFELLPDTAHFKDSMNAENTIPYTRSLANRLILLPAFTKYNRELIQKYSTNIEKLFTGLNG